MILNSAVVIAVVLAPLLLLPVQQATSSTIPQLERVTISDLVILDQEDGVLSTDLAVGSKVLIRSTIMNAQMSDQPFVSIAQIKDMNKVMVLLSWLTGELFSQDSFDASTSWVPEAAGEYTIEVAVWDSLDSPLPLSHLLSTTVTVNPERSGNSVVTLRIMDEETGAPVIGASVVVSDRHAKIVFTDDTDRDGEVELVLRNGDYMIVIQATGYNKITEALQIDADAQIALELPHRCTGPYPNSC